MDTIDAFEYIVLQMGRCYVEANGLNNFAQFNKNNNFDEKKCLLLPFFIATANSGRHFFFSKYFQEMKAVEYGHIENKIKNKLEEGKNAFKNFQISTFQTEINDIDGLLSTTVEDGKLKLKIKSLFIVNGEEDEELISRIDHSIDDILCKKDKIGFESFYSNDLSSYSRRHLSWEIYYKRTEFIDSEILIKEKSMYSEQKEYRMYI